MWNNKVSKHPVLHDIKVLTAKIIKFWGKTYDYVTTEELALVKDMVNKQSNHYVRWALRQLSIWDKPEIVASTKIFQIHGDSNKTFPIARIKEPDIVIKEARHNMLYKQAQEITEIIIDELKI